MPHSGGKEAKHARERERAWPERTTKILELVIAVLQLLLVMAAVSQHW